MLNQVSIRSDNKELKTSPLMGYVGQHPNNKWFSLFKVPLGIYSLSGSDSTKRFNRFIRRLGEPPVIYDSVLSQKTRLNIQNAVQNMGYLNAEVKLVEVTNKKHIGVRYYVQPHQRYKVSDIQRDIQDTAVASLLKQDGYVSLLQNNMPFDLNVLESERNRLNTHLQNNGYYNFNKDFIRFEADTTLGNHLVDLKMILQNYSAGRSSEPVPHQRYTIGNITYNIPISHNKPFVRHKVVASANELVEGNLYCEKDVQGSYSRLSRLGAVQSSRINLSVNPEDSTKLDAEINVSPSKRNSFNIELEGTNSAGDLGVAVALSYQNRNLFRGSELLNMKARGAFEAIKGLRGYSDQNFIEYSFEAGISFPDFICPFLRQSFRKRALATSELSFMFDSQDRPEFHRRVLTTSWRYKWTRASRRMQHRIDLLDINYVFMPWISDTFRERYLDNPESRNAILRYNYENLFIVKWGYNFFYSSRSLNANSKNYGTNAYIIEGNFLLFGKTSQELASIYSNMLPLYLGQIYFTPANIVAQGNPCLEVGDRIRLHTRYATIDTYILQRTMTGIQSLRDNYVSTSPKQRSEQVNSTNHSLLALSGKTNVLNRTIEETQSIITDDILSPTNPLSLQSQITQNASEIETIVRQLYGNCEYYEREGAPTLLNYPAWDFCSNIPCNDTVATTDDLGFVYTSTDYFNHLNALVYDTQNNKVYRFVYNSSTLNYEWNDITDTETAQILEKITRVSQTVEGLTSTVTATELEVADHEFRITKNESEISQQADRIELKVSKDDVVSSISQSAEEISIDANRINLNGAVTANNNVEIGVDGKIHIQDGEIINVTGTDRIRINDTIDLQSYSDVGGYWYDNLKITPLASGSIDFYYDNGYWGGKVYGDSVSGGVAIQTTEYGAFSVLISGTRKMRISKDYIPGQTNPVYGILEGLWYGTLQSPSDRDLKKNIKDINKALIDIVGDIPLKQFEFKSNEGVVEIGIIAQDLAEELEKQGLTNYGIVSTFTQDGKQYKAVNYTEFLIARNQYLEQRIDDLESRIERLENLMKGENQ